MINLRSEDGEEKVRVTYELGHLTVRGASEYRSKLAYNIERFARDEILGHPTHIHIEHYPDHPYLGSCSLPLIVAVG